MADEAIERYALAMVLSGAESFIEDNLNEDGALTPEQHTRACEFGYALLQAIRDESTMLTRSAREVHEPDTGSLPNSDTAPYATEADHV